MINNPKYISDLITTPEIQTWSPGDRILISAPTGAGKTWFVANSLYQYCKDNNKKILLLENRIILKEQIIQQLEEGYEDTLTIKLYQNLESKIKNNDYSSEGIFEGYDYVFADEGHYFAGDSSFNVYSDLVLKGLIENHSNLVLIFASATPYSLTETGGIIRNTKEPYIIKPDFSFIKKLYFYNSDSSIEKMLANVPNDEKVIYFGSAKNSHRLYKEFKNSNFVCAKGNQDYYKQNPKDQREKDLIEEIDDTAKQIIETESFSSKYLFTTRVMDNGVSIKDKSVTRMVIDDSFELVVLTQMLGRKRIVDEDDGVILYIKNHHENVIKAKVETLKKILRKAEKQLELGVEEFITENKKTPLPNIFDTDGQLNQARYMNIKFQLNKYEIMLSKERKYRQVVCNILQQEIEESVFLEREFFTLSAEEILFKYQERKLFKQEQRMFRDEFLAVVLNSREGKKLGYNTIKGILEDTKNKLRFEIDNGQETKGENRNKTFWHIYRVPEV